MDPAAASRAALPHFQLVAEHPVEDDLAAIFRRTLAAQAHLLDGGSLVAGSAALDQHRRLADGVIEHEGQLGAAAAQRLQIAARSLAGRR